MSGETRLFVWPQGDVWRWTYEEPSADGAAPFRLDSSVAFLDPAEAGEAATVAFPGVPVEVRQGQAPERGGPDRGGPTGSGLSRLADLALAAAVAVLVLAVPDRGRLVASWLAVGSQALARAFGSPAPASTRSSTPIRSKRASGGQASFRGLRSVR